MPNDVTIIIANLGRPDNLLPCLRSLADAAGPGIAYRVVVGFNFPGDSDLPATLAREFPEVEQLRAQRKLGYCRAYNQLMAHKTGRYVLILDDDTVLAPRCLETMVGFMDAHSDVGIAGCRTRNWDGSYQKTTARMFTMRNELINILSPGSFWRDGIDENTSEWAIADWLNSHFLIVRSEVIDRVGALDEFFYTFMLEADWCLRIRDAGWKVAYAPQAEVMHIGGAHSNQPGLKSYKNLLRTHINRYYFMRKHYGDAAMFAFRAVMSLGALLRVVNYLAVWLFSRTRRQEAAVKIAAYTKITLLGLTARPDALPQELQRENDVFDASLQPVLAR